MIKQVLNKNKMIRKKMKMMFVMATSRWHIALQYGMLLIMVKLA